METGIDYIGDEYIGETPQGQFVIIHVTVENIGDESRYLDGGNQTVFDADDREYSADTSLAFHLEDSQTFLNSINPGNVVEGKLLFDMPVDVEPASIELHDSMFSGGVTVDL